MKIFIKNPWLHLKDAGLQGNYDKIIGNKL
jgi:hypothetical protein